MKKILVVGISTFNEADTITKTAHMIDAGLQRLRGIKGIIVNADNKSPDGTAGIFSKLSLRADKKTIMNERAGKGVNMISILGFCHDIAADAVIFFDSDVVSMREDWVEIMSNGLLGGGLDATFPAYRRSRYDGTVTNQVVFPTLTALTGKIVAQPIGGEFGFGRAAINAIISRKSKDIDGYGIDVFLTSTILGQALRFEQRWLGEKVHRPGQNKVARLFGEVFSSLCHNLPELLGVQNILPANSAEFEYPNVLDLEDSLSPERRMRFEMEWQIAKEKLSGNTSIFIDKKLLSTNRVGMEAWVAALAAALECAYRQPDDLAKISDELFPIFLARNLAFWDEVADRPSREVERIILKQAEYLRREPSLKKLLEIG